MLPLSNNYYSGIFQSLYALLKSIWSKCPVVEVEAHFCPLYVKLKIGTPLDYSLLKFPFPSICAKDYAIDGFSPTKSMKRYFISLLIKNHG